uniref:Rap guanine nucleotide exchange factor (GEF) 5a n=1 Tax=Neogobius melanostomus TaxID=47308 RepID=A0A8C6WFH7_9GOBI
IGSGHIQVNEDEEEGSELSSTSDSISRLEPLTMPTFDVPYFRYIDDEGTEGEEDWSSRSLSSIEEDSSTDSALSHRYVVVSGTPEKILEHLLNNLRVEDEQGNTYTLLDDFLLTYPIFMSTSDLCQRYRRKEDKKEVLQRKQKVLRMVLQWMKICRNFLREDPNVKAFVKTLYRYALEDLYEHPALERDLRELQGMYQLHRRNTSDEYSPHRKRVTINLILFYQYVIDENIECATCVTVLCHVYISMDSYLSVRASAAIVAHELLRAVAERMDVPLGDLVLVAITYPGGRLLLQPQDRVFSESLRAVGRCILYIILTILFHQNPFTDNSELQQRTTHMLSLNTWDVAVALTNLDWALFDSIHEQQLIYFTFSRLTTNVHTVMLELLLKRCNEVQLWVMTEVLLCPTLCKRSLQSTFFVVVDSCKAQKNFNCFFAIIMGLNSAAVSRLTQTWEKIPGKFKKLFSELETMTDPSLNHKTYRESFKKMKAPKIPFLPLLLKDITFIHEGNKTFHDNLVNFEKLHMIAEAVRIIRQCQNDISSEVRAYVDFLHIIDNQQTLFELSVKLEPRA